MGLILKVGNTRYNFFNKATVEMNYAATASSFRMSAYFDRTLAQHRNLFRPLSFPEITLETTRGEKLITGTVLNQKFSLDSTQRLATLEGYSTTGILGDVQIPVDKYPLEFNGLSLLEIAEQLTQQFGIKVGTDNDGGIASQAIETITARNSEPISEFLTRIASQRNLVITHDENKNLIFTRHQPNTRPIVDFTENRPVTLISLQVDGQKMHSNYTVLKQTQIDNDNASQATVDNPIITVDRPRVVLQNVGNDNTVEDAAKNQRAAELKNIRLKIRTSQWEWPINGSTEVMRPNNVIGVISPENFIFNKTNFFVERVKLILDEKKEVAELDCVLPQVFSNEDPPNIFS